MYLLGAALYLTIITLIFYRFTFLEMTIHRHFVYLAVLAWTLTFVGMLRSLIVAKRPLGTQSSVPPPIASPSAERRSL